MNGLKITTDKWGKELSLMRRHSHWWCVSWDAYRFCCSERVWIQKGFLVGKITSSWVEPVSEESGRLSYLCVSRLVGVRAVSHAGDSTFPWPYCRDVERRQARLLSSGFHVDRLLSDGFVVVTKCLPWEQRPLSLLTCLSVMRLRCIFTNIQWEGC